MADTLVVYNPTPSDHTVHHADFHGESAHAADPPVDEDHPPCPYPHGPFVLKAGTTTTLPAMVAAHAARQLESMGVVVLSGDKKADEALKVWADERALHWAHEHLRMVRGSTRFDKEPPTTRHETTLAVENWLKDKGHEIRRS